ncbi:L-threonylcarbamoyladenylate synthase [Elusimicrobium simillimum]|uniref:L-threonylcarbamoyladenylate synthase n=1 Tax=Elusimicrobium simillimum TaxID=3143438 RepID=UPI003C702B6B
MTKIFKVKDLTAENITEVAAALNNGAVVIMPTDTVYGIVANAADDAAVARMCETKQKPFNVPLQYLVKNVHTAKEISALSEKANKIADTYWPGPLTMIVPPSKKGRPYLRGFDTLGIRVPDHELTVKILNTFGGILAASSANMHGTGLVNSEEGILKQFDGRVDYILLDGELKGMASTILTPEPLVVIREGAVTEKEVLELIK